MNGKMHDSILFCLGGILLLILFFPLPCIAQDAFPSLKFLISPLPGTLAGLPMEISFNGRGGQETPQEISERDRFARDHSADKLSGPAVSPDSPGTEVGASQAVYLKIQAGLDEPGGALFIVIPIQ